MTAGNTTKIWFSVFLCILRVFFYLWMPLSLSHTHTHTHKYNIEPCLTHAQTHTHTHSPFTVSNFVEKTNKLFFSHLSPSFFPLNFLHCLWCPHTHTHTHTQTHTQSFIHKSSQCAPSEARAVSRHSVTVSDRDRAVRSLRTAASRNISPQETDQTTRGLHRD